MSDVHKVTQGLTAEQVESFKENGFLGPFDLSAEDGAPLVWSQAMIDMVTSENKILRVTIISTISSQPP
jgi:non-heme Fe2+,alpha-ketoglutarate-dependent halogenase